MVGTNMCKIMAVIKKMFIFYLYELVANTSGGVNYKQGCMLLQKHKK